MQFNTLDISEKYFTVTANGKLMWIKRNKKQILAPLQILIELTILYDWF